MKHKALSVIKADQRFWSNPITVVLSAVLLFLGSQLLGALLVSPLLMVVTDRTYQLLLLVAASLLSCLGLLTIARQTIGFSWQTIGLNKVRLKQLWLLFPAVAIYVAASAILTSLAMRIVPNFDINQVQDLGFSKPSEPSQLIAVFLALVVITPVFEELIFRGVLFRGLRRRLPFWAAALVVSLLFAVAHQQWNVAADTMALGLVLCALVEKTNSIWPGILLHALKNALAFGLLYFWL